MAQPTSEQIEQWLKDLRHPDAYRRRLAAEALGWLEASEERIVRALESVAANDSNKYVREAARKALLAPAHQPFTTVGEALRPPAGTVSTAKKAEANPERSEARRLYLLSLWSPLLAAFLICGGPAILLLPLVFLILVLTGFRSRHVFVRWHTGQWVVLTLAAIGLVVLSLAAGSSRYGPSSGVIGFDLLILGGWYVGNIIGLSQANHGHCWLWKWLDRRAELPRPWARPGATPTAAPSAHGVPSDPVFAFGQGESHLKQGNRAEAVASFLAAFRKGPPDLRRRALAELEKLREVEMF